MDPDYMYALLLQEQLSHENVFESSPKPEKTVYGQNKENYYKDNSVVVRQKENLIDPSWEMIDPTPNIYSLFMQFDKRFFWSKLNAVIVKWSKRMTTCAGICRYEGRGGACTVSLSEPLLKLRPRKDLIETLLHEMIHAYLFVTHNNRDRDGHGPEFHKHMYRINSEAGTKISVYHDFHDEVRLYKTHWWRCNGPCQNRRPYFGMVKRAYNRAPGPNDRWWDEHERTCGGVFIKVREPDSKSRKRGELATKSVPVTDIRTYFDDNSNKSPIKLGSSQNIRTLKDLNSEKLNKVHNPKSSTVTNSSGTSNISSLTNSKSKLTKPGTSVLNKGGGTLVINSKNAKPNEPPKDENPLRINTFKPFSGDGHILKGAENQSTAKTETDEYVNVRNFWLNKFNYETNNKRSSTEPESSSKKSKSDDFVDLTEDSEDENKCPLCSKTLTSSEISTHVDSCLESSFNDDFDDLEDADVASNNKNINCLVCNKLINESQLNVHLESCITHVFEDELNPEQVIDGVEVPQVQETIRFNSTEEKCVKTHSEVLEIPQAEPTTVRFSNFEEKIVACPCCPKLMPESEINNHLDVCLSMNDDFFGESN